MHLNIAKPTSTHTYPPQSAPVLPQSLSLLLSCSRSTPSPRTGGPCPTRTPPCTRRTEEEILARDGSDTPDSEEFAGNKSNIPGSCRSEGSSRRTRRRSAARTFRFCRCTANSWESGPCKKDRPILKLWESDRPSIRRSKWGQTFCPFFRIKYSGLFVPRRFCTLWRCWWEPGVGRIRRR